MKLNYREKVILMVVLIIVVWVVGIMFVIKPSYSKMKDSSAKYDSKKIEIETKKDQIDADVNLNQDITKAYAESNDLRVNFYPTYTPDDVCEKVDQLLDIDSIVNDGMVISLYESTILSPFSVEVTAIETDVDKAAAGQLSETDEAAAPATTPEDVDITDEDLSLPVVIPNYSVNFGYKCSLENLKAFLDKLNTNTEKSLVVTSCEIKDVNGTEGQTEVEGTISMSFMMIPELKDPNAE